MIILTLFLLLPLALARDTRYECGPHGRFEYCVDGIPGCVIGCHCHPGYYFDPDTKICEPNTKLTQNYGRHYILHTPAQNLPENDLIPETLSSTTPHELDEHVDEIAKDTDDLSDWLYNQFFKTIENQVINKTDDDDFMLKGTRRQGGKPLQLTMKKAHRNRKRKKRTKKPSHRGLKKRLFKLTDDAIFESSSSDSSDTSDSSSSSSNLESWENYEWSDREKNKQKSNKNKGSHENHRKIIVFNKKPKPSLPSFIFLPNMETPFYPPIGLPAPPPIQMFPLVPVQPLVPGLPSDNNLSTTAHPPKNDVTTKQATDEPEKSESPIINDMTATASPPVGSTVPEQEKHGDQKKIYRMNGGENVNLMDYFNTESEHPATFSPEIFNLWRKHLKSKTNSDLFNSFKERRLSPLSVKKSVHPKINRLNKHKENYFWDPQTAPIINEEGLQEPLELNEIPSTTEDVPLAEKVDFKYLSQLIHRVDSNATKSKPDYKSIKNIHNVLNRKPIKYRSSMHPKGLKTLNTKYNTRRFETEPSDPDEPFYTNLGRQIAMLIRGTSSPGERQIDITAVENNDNHNEPFLNENSFSPRSYWERSVRSPLYNFLTNSKYHENLSDSDKKLFELESKISSAVTTQSTLNLQDIENIVNKINDEIKYINPKKDSYKQSDSSLKLNLLTHLKEISNYIPKMALKNSDYVHGTKYDINYKRTPPRNFSKPKSNVVQFADQRRNTQKDNKMFNNIKSKKNLSILPRSDFQTQGKASIIVRPGTDQEVNTNMLDYFSVDIRPQSETVYTQGKPVLKEKTEHSYFFNDFDDTLL